MQRARESQPLSAPSRNAMPPARSARPASASSTKEQPSDKPPEKTLYGSMSDWASAMAQDPEKALRETAHWLETSEDTDPAHWLASCCDDFRPRKIKAPLVLGWLVVQVVGLLFQVLLLSEISSHLVDFENALAAHCGPEHLRADICLGPTWNLSYSGTLSFPQSDMAEDKAGFDYVIPADRTFRFRTQSAPATFLVAVQPKAPQASAKWKLSIQQDTLSQGDSDWFPGRPTLSESTVYGSGTRYKVLNSRSYWGGDPNNRGKINYWTGSLVLTSSSTGPTDIYVYVVDSRIEHLEDIHKQDQCSFEDSWRNFSERQNGHHHQVLVITRTFVMFFMMVSCTLTGFVLYRFYYYVESGKLLSRTIFLKFFVQDWPQQVCIVAYIYGWYAKNGLRCQMCLFHPLHCDTQTPLHWSNFMVCIFTVLSASANQLLLQAKVRRKNYDDDDECCNFCFRVALFSVSALPFTTAIYLFPFWFPKGSHMILTLCAAGVPMVVGWFGVLCGPMLACCGDDGGDC